MKLKKKSHSDGDISLESIQSLLKAYSEQIKLKEKHLLAVSKRLETEFGVNSNYNNFESIKEEDNEMDTSQL